MEKKLLPCPFCGYKVSWCDGAGEDGYWSVDDDKKHYVISCPDCVRATVDELSIEEAVKKWNARIIKYDKIPGTLLNFMCYLVDNHEGATITEEFLLLVGSEFMNRNKVG